MTSSSFRFRLVLVLAFAVALGGCRLYGEFDAGEENVRQIRLANEEFAEDLALVQQDVALLEQTLTNDPGLQGFVDQLRIVTLAHETILQGHREIYQDLTEGGFTTYRDASRALAGILAEMEMVRSRYRQLLPDENVVGDPRATAAWNTLDRGRYFVAPPYYQRLIQRDRLVSIAPFVAQNRILFEADSTAVVAEDSLGVQPDSAQVVPADSVVGTPAH